MATRWYGFKRSGTWTPVTPEKAAELLDTGGIVRLGQASEVTRWANGVCGECGKRMADGDQGRWSPYFCAPCDAERMERLDKQFDALGAR
jgi:hypothetical protein